MSPTLDGTNVKPLTPGSPFVLVCRLTNRFNLLR